MISILLLLLSSFTVKGDTLFVEGPQIVVIDDNVEVIKPSWEKIHEPKSEVIIHADTLYWDPKDWWKPDLYLEDTVFWVPIYEGKTTLELETR